MNKTMSEKLKKRTFADTVLSCIFCFCAIVGVVYQFIGYVNHPKIKEYISNGLFTVVIFAELCFLSLILLEIRKTGKPFSKKIITKLRVMAIILFGGGLIPSYMTSSISENESLVSATFDMQNVLIIALGVIIGIISEIFVYGLSLQEDNDSIA